MRFITAVALATVMLWVPVDASGQEVTIEAVSQQSGYPELDPSSSTWVSNTFMTFESRNNTSRTIVAWRGHLEIRSPFDELIWEGDLIFGEDNDVPANGSVRSEHRMSTNNETEGFNLDDYQSKDMEFLWTKVQVRY